MAPVDFSEWYQSAYPRLTASLVVIAWDAELARDAVSEACVRALERWPRVSVMSSPEAWVYRVAINLLRRHNRRLAIERRLLRRLVQRSTVEPVEIDPQVAAAVRSLPARQREAIALRYVLGMRQDEIATAMRVSAGTVASTLHSARKQLAVSLRMPDADGPDEELSEVE